MSINFDGSTDYYDNGSWAGPTAAPLSMAGWANTNSTAAQHAALTIKFDVDNYFQLLMNTGGAIRMVTAAGASNFSVTSGSMGTNAWHHLGGTTSSATNRIAYLDGTAATPATTSRIPTAPDTIRLGVNSASTPALHWDGELAHFGVWNRVLEPEEMTGLAQGWHPRFYSRGLVWLWDGFKLGESDVYGLTMTENGSPAKSDEHPPVIRPSTAAKFSRPAASHFPGLVKDGGAVIMPAPSVTVRVSAY